MDIYPKPTDLMNESVERAYSIGFDDGVKSVSEPTDTFSNLTKAIHDGEQIDYIRLDGKIARIVHITHGHLSTRLDLQVDSSGIPIHSNLEEPYAWRNDNESLACLFDDAWLGKLGWYILIDGEIPVKKRTADELEPSTCFRGRVGTAEPELFIRYDYPDFAPTGNARVIPLSGGGSRKASQVEVIEEYGPGVFLFGKK